MSQLLFVTDLDNTLVGDDEALENLKQKLNHHRQEHGTKIVYATGRSPLLYRQLKAEKSLPDPDALITSVGTEIYANDASDTPDPEWSKILAQGWNLDAIVAITSHFADLVPQPDSEQRPFKVSYYLTEEASVEVLPQLQSLLQQRNLAVNVIYSGGKDLDILPRHGNKGEAMQFLEKRWKIDETRTVACGDSGNDITLFSVGEERGIIVGNAQPELLQWYHKNPSAHRYLAKAHCAAGILEGLKYFDFL